MSPSASLIYKIPAAPHLAQRLTKALCAAAQPEGHVRFTLPLAWMELQSRREATSVRETPRLRGDSKLKVF